MDAQPGWASGLTCAGEVSASGLDIAAPSVPPGRVWHRYGRGPFADLEMPWLPQEPGIYVWAVDGEPVYVGKTAGALARRLGPTGYARIHRANTLAAEAGRRNGGQQTNCRINALANVALVSGQAITLWYAVCDRELVTGPEQGWMTSHGVPPWNRRDERRLQHPVPPRTISERLPAQEVEMEEGAVPDSSFEQVWKRIVALEGDVFRQKRGGKFTFSVIGSTLDLDRTNQRIARAHLEEAYRLCPLANTMPVQHLRGPSYLYAILMDDRVRSGEW